jgi:CheY-like chemotaxis protein
MPAGPAPVNADPARLVQIVTNLLNNAAKYTPDGGDIRLSSWVEDSSVVIELADNGLGIPAEDQVRLFDLFTQLSHTGSKAHGGLGIGLSIVKSLVEMHGGSVGVRSAGVGQGSTFRVELPLATPVATPDRAAPMPVSTHRGRILVVEDNPDGLGTLVELIEANGHAVIGVADGHEALRVAREWTPSVVLLDLGLPQMDGYEVAARLRNDLKLMHTRIVALTGWGTQADKARTAASGFDGHITKPVSPERLLKDIDEWLAEEAIDS